MWHQPGIFFPVELFRQVGGLDENLWMSMDMDLMCRFLTRTSAVCLDIPLVMFREHAGAKTQQTRYRGWTCNRRISKRYWKDLPEPVDSGEFRDTFCRHCIGMAGNLYRARRWGELREMLAASFSESPWTTLRLLLERRLPGRSRD